MQESLLSDIIVGVYALSIIFILIYTAGQFNLLYYFKTPHKKKRFHPALPVIKESNLPMVTVQLPMYNEKYVAKAVIDACAKLDYPSDKLEVQVVDDSTDETIDIVEQCAKEWVEKGINVTVVHRENRKGFKAGALKDATPLAKGEFIAIFDADFRPNPDFLLKTIPYFEDPKVGIVQGRWGHINREYSNLTKSQSLFLDMFFKIEQQARSLAGLFLRFNGSGGVWRRTCINDAGGWSADTLSEDLDLAFRAQIKEWKVIYDVNVIAPAEVPVTMADFKAQQYRWTKGKAQVIRKLYKPLWNKKLGIWKKIHVYYDLLNIFTIPSIMVLALLSTPINFILLATDVYNSFLAGFSFALINVILAPLFAYIVLKEYNTSAYETFKDFLSSIFPFIFLMLGMSVFQLVSAVEGFFSDKVFFHRTSKYNIVDKNDSWKDKIYKPSEISTITYFEGLLALYFLWGIYIDIKYLMIGFLPFHIMLVLSFGYVFVLSARKS
jgi:cellulose synthase/poly-beta-1,6-N-acetylglucosamine synthase-like glycosyltransferase